MNDVDAKTHRAILSAPSRSDDRIIDLRYLFPIIRRWFWVAVLAMAVAATHGLWDMHNYQPTHVATMIVAPLDGGDTIGTEGGGGGGGLQGALVNLGFGQAARSGTQFDRFVHSVSTITLAKRLQEKYGLLQIVYKGAWNETTQSWREPGGEAHERSERARLFFNLAGWSPPDLEDLAKYLGAKFEVKEIKGTSFKSISFAHPDPDLALYLLKIVLEEALTKMREDSQKQMVEQKRYLEERLSKTTMVDLRASLVSLLATEERRAMMFQGDAPFVVRVIDPPYISKFLSQPDKLRLVLLPAFIAFAASLSLIVLIAFLRNE